jgi:ferredoxin
MPYPSGHILICSCDGTMKLDADAVRRTCGGAQVTTAQQLCGTELVRFRTLAGEAGPLMVGCTQEAAVFAAEAEAAGRADPVTMVNIRETAGWSNEGAEAGPKMAALIAAAAEKMPAVPFDVVKSDGVVLIYGSDEQAIEAGVLLKDHLDVTVLLRPGADVMPARVNEFPLAKGTIRAVRGHLGAFEVTVDAFARPMPSSRAALSFGPSRDGAVSRADIILDVSGGPPLFSAPDLRDGYLRADPGNPASVLHAVLRARDLVGSFDKPHYIAFSSHLCAHSRSGITGCTRCLELCPAGAIAPAGDHVAIDAAICAGCGQCAAACPTGAASYAMPPADALMRKLRALLLAYRQAGGERAVVLLHDEPHGTKLIDALARFGDGLPASVLPLAVNEVTQVGLETVAAAFAYGASAVRFLLRARPRHDIAGLIRTIALGEPILSGLGFGPERVATIETDDPDALGGALRAIPPLAAAPRPSSFLPMGGEKRSVLRFALRELHQAAPEPADMVALPQGAPFGSVRLDVAGCTLCLSCVASCPTGALGENADRPMLRFTEDACVQCGLCQATCPEKVITLEPRIDFRPATATARVLKEEEPFCCVRCGKPFGVKSTIDRVVSKLAGKHWMFKDSPSRLELIKMCDDCRVSAVSEENFDPYAAPRKLVRTTDDYLRERDAGAAPGKEQPG